MAQDGATAIVSGAEVHAILIINVLGSFSTRATLFAVATERGHAPNVHAMREAAGAKTIAMAIVSGGEVLAVLAVLIMNVLGPSLTQAT